MEGDECSIDEAIAEAAGVEDNNDKMVESIQISSHQQTAKARQDSIKDSRSS